MTIYFFAKPDKPNDEDLQAFFDNLDLILQHKKEIDANPEYRHIFIQGCGCFPLYMPTITLSIGELLKLWEETEWKQDGKYFYSITGSPLSGGNCSKYWSADKGFGSVETTLFSRQIRTALWLIQTGSTEVKSQCTPVEIPNRAPSKLTINDLIDILRQR